MDISLKFFKRVAYESINFLPTELKNKLYNIDIIVQEYPDIEIRNKFKVHKNNILGLYKGVPFGKRSYRYANVLPDRIILYRRPIVKVCKNQKQLREKIKQVVFHEIGHYFGFTDKQLKILENDYRN